MARASFPALSFVVGSAPASSRSLQTSRCPLDTARIRADRPRVSVASRSVPARRCIRTDSTAPASTAILNAGLSERRRDPVAPRFSLSGLPSPRMATSRFASRGQRDTDLPPAARRVSLLQRDSARTWLMHGPNLARCARTPTRAPSGRQIRSRGAKRLRLRKPLRNHAPLRAESRPRNETPHPSFRGPGCGGQRRLTPQELCIAGRVKEPSLRSVSRIRLRFLVIGRCTERERPADHPDRRGINSGPVGRNRYRNASEISSATDSGLPERRWLEHYLAWSGIRSPHAAVWAIRRQSASTSGHCGRIVRKITLWTRHIPRA